MFTAKPLIKNVTTGNITFSITGSFSFCLISFLIIIPIRKILKYINLSRFNKNSFLDEFNITNWNSVMEIEKTVKNIF